MMYTHEKWMQKTLTLAEAGRLTVSPNPMVACLVVKDGKLIAQAYHQKAGQSHAEALALDLAGEQANGATLYINLEPCCHQGRTPPCVDRVIASGVSRVVCATQDPNPLVSGQGIAALKAASIDVIEGVLENEARTLNQFFFHAMIMQRPYVIAKWAMSLDGQTICADTDDCFITGEKSQQHVHQQRAMVDAILIGANTLIRDNPQLTVRLTATEKQPLRVVIAERGGLPLDARLFNDAYAFNTLVYLPSGEAELASSLQKKDVQVCLIAPDPLTVLKDLHKRHIRSLYIEGGAKTHKKFIAADLVDEYHCYIAPVIVANLPKKTCVLPLVAEALGDDVFISAKIKRSD
ncbi:MAG: riboflavin biosynthesis protein RibD [Gammaproteobacteria bacterium CG11_big_fil_rev_8_21_14_0_20_46_22]|nr:MAG: riboflavin biosynthesis protein RibD [Gammaproteobacteria bacterium CG12_big_fil_rev_8_21_14_0_65_46_12]PIR11731.1 MAG: riboflavin biosynthesis protein RibD [Gammaproteobacteria bacterium CG11_big_fil_rev_8_21_14_0_20_46_22]